MNALDGPVLVIAGPGTGKTELLSVRVAHILKTTDAGAQNILCLTFTNKAATNMRNRLFSIIGPDAYKIDVKTFHSFAADIMNQYPDYFWNGARLTSVPDVVQLEIITDILQSLSLENPLGKRFAGKLTGLNDVQTALKLAKEAGLTPEKLSTIIAVNLQYIDSIENQLVTILSDSLKYKNLPQLVQRVAELPDQNIDSAIAPLQSLRSVICSSLEYAVQADEGTNKTTETGKWKRRFLKSVGGTKGMHDERARNNWWLALSGVYQAYRDQLHARGYYDYADMLVEVISCLEQHPELQSDVQERYTYVLVDEFQDTNPAQLRLAHLVADHFSSNGKPNLMVVGDDDQSIFKFNGAELNNMLGFRSFYKIDTPIVLTKNYRSTQAILDTAKVVAELAEDRIVNRERDITKDLIAANTELAAGSITHISYPTRQHQNSVIAKRISEEFKSGDHSIAVLARNHQSLLHIAEVLHALNVPLHYEKQNNVMQNEAVEQMILLAEILAAKQQGDLDTINAKLAILLCHPLWGITSEDLWELALENRHQPHWLESMHRHRNSSVNTLAVLLDEFARLSATTPLPLMIEYIFGLRDYKGHTIPIRNYFFQNKHLSRTYIESLSALQIIRDMCNEFARPDSATLLDFVKFIRINRENGKQITDESLFVSAETAVKLLTIHKAKGQEFDSVYIIDAVENIWKPRVGGRKPPANLPLQAYGDDIDDYVRLFYVATTRAKRNLNIASYYTDVDGSEIMPAPFARIAVKPVHLDMQDAGDPIETLQHTLRWPVLDSDKELLLLYPLLQKFSLSVTALINFLDVASGGPLYFKERNLLRLPETKSIRQSFGTAIHRALEYAQTLVNRDEYSIESVLHAYEKALAAEHVPPDEFKRYALEGQKVLRSLLVECEYVLPKHSVVERSLNATLEGEVNITGKIDRIDIHKPRQLVIADYKTGKPLANLASMSQNTAIKAWKHRTQLIFYALLANTSSQLQHFTDVECQMVYVEATEARQIVRSYTPTNDEINRLKTITQRVWQKIQKADFPDISQYPRDIKGILAFEEDLLNGTI